MPYPHSLQWIDALGFSQVPVLLSEWAANDDWNPGQSQPASNCTLIGPFAGGGKWVCGAFRDYYNQYGVGILGYPISPELNFTTKDGWVIRAQWFERARLEHNPAVTPIPIQGGLLGCEASSISGPGC